MTVTLKTHGAVKFIIGNQLAIRYALFNSVDVTLNVGVIPGAGNEQTNPWITNDFLETMSEVVTPPAAHALDAMHYLFSINNALRSALSPGELLWPLSMPPRLPKDKSAIPLAKMGPEKEAYLKEWVKRHGFSAGTPCGAHINLSIDPHVFELVLDQMGDRFKSKVELQNYLYAKVAQGFLRYRWVITYLFGASPIAEANYFKSGEGPKKPIPDSREKWWLLNVKLMSFKTFTSLSG